MSVISTAANYGGRITDNQQGVKQFYIGGQNTVLWIYKKITNYVNGIKTTTLVETPADNKKPIFINNDLIVTGSIINYNSNSTGSDENLKNIGNEISLNVANKLLNLNPKTFVYKNDNDKNEHFGLIAQEVEKIYPSLVDSTHQYKTVNYIELISLMIVKIKELNDKIECLENNFKQSN